MIFSFVFWRNWNTNPFIFLSLNESIFKVIAFAIFHRRIFNVCWFIRLSIIPSNVKQYLDSTSFFVLSLSCFLTLFFLNCLCLNGEHLLKYAFLIWLCSHLALSQAQNCSNNHLLCVCVLFSSDTLVDVAKQSTEKKRKMLVRFALALHCTKASNRFE